MFDYLGLKFFNRSDLGLTKHTSVQPILTPASKIYVYTHGLHDITFFIYRN